MSDSWAKHEEKVQQWLDGGSGSGQDLVRTHERQIGYLQQERMAHLLVTLFVGLCALMTVLVTLILKEVILAVLDGLLLGLFIPYIFHYRALENRLQRWYRLADKMRA